MTARLLATQRGEAHEQDERAAPTRTGNDPERLATALLVLFTLGTLDAVLTLAGLARGGIELNPLARALLARGPVTFVATRVVSQFGAMAVFRWLAPAAPRAARACVLGACAFFAAIDACSAFQLVLS